MSEPEYGLTENERKAAFAFKKHALEVCILGGSARAVYRVFLDRMNWRYRTSFCGRKDLCKEAKISPRTLDGALKILRDTGHIEAIAYPRGGRGMSPVYRFARAEMLKNGANNSNEQTYAKTSAETSDTENNQSEQTYAKTSAETSAEPAYPTESEYKKDAPSRREHGDKAASQRQMSDEDRKFHELLRVHTYGEAKRLLEVWKAEQDEAA